MARTIESIVDCHVAATSRRKAGRPVWASTVPVKPILAEYKSFGDDLTPEQALELWTRIGKLLNVRVPKAWRDSSSDNYSMDFEGIMERMEFLSVQDFTPSVDLPNTPCEITNQWLEELFDWGDSYRVWLD